VKNKLPSTEVTFETAALADSMQKAAVIAPNTGHAFDQAAGIVMIIDTEEEMAILKATDTQSRYMEWIEPIECSGPSTILRMPSKMVSGVVSSLPVGSGKTVKFKREDNTIHITSGRTRFKCSLITMEYYPDWGAFNSDEFISVPNFGARFKQVDWAVSNSGSPPLTGVFVDGKILAATDKYRIATVPMEFEAKREFSVQPSALSVLLNDKQDIKIGMSDVQFYLMPDDHSQIQSVICDLPFPNIYKLMKRDYPEQVSVSKQSLIECISRSKHVIGSNRSPMLRAWFGRGELAFAVTEDTALLGDVIDVPTQAEHARCEFGFSHSNLIAALTNCPNEIITLGYDPKNKRTNLYINGGSGYESWVATRIKAD